MTSISSVLVYASTICVYNFNLFSKPSPIPSHYRAIRYSDNISFIVDFAFDMPPLRRTYASQDLSFNIPSQSAVNMHDSSVSSESVPSPAAPVVQPKVGKPAVKLPSFQASPLSPRRSMLHRWSLQLDHQIFPPFKPGLNLYRFVLKREFLRSTRKARKARKAMMNNAKAPTTYHTMHDDQ